MDLILTGRPVSAEEAAHIGLANRVAPPGNALETAVQLAEQIARHPSLCMQNDRRSAIEQWSLTEEQAMRNELALGLETIQSGETASGAASFRAGAGRHGSFDDES